MQKLTKGTKVELLKLQHDVKAGKQGAIVAGPHAQTGHWLVKFQGKSWPVDIAPEFLKAI
jgi:hypothetical protein